MSIFSRYAEFNRVVKGNITTITLPYRVLDPKILKGCDAIAQQLNCIGCWPAGLAKGVAQALPYGCSYKYRQPGPADGRFAEPLGYGVPGIIDIR